MPPLTLWLSHFAKLFAWGEGDSGGYVLRETTSRGLVGLVCPSRTNEHGGEGDCVKEGEGGEGDCERERALGVLVVEMLTPWCRAHGSKACGRAARWAVEQTCLEGIPTACCRGGFIQN